MLSCSGKKSSFIAENASSASLGLKDWLLCDTICTPHLLSCYKQREIRFFISLQRVYAQNDKIKGINNGDEEELAVNYCA